MCMRMWPRTKLKAETLEIACLLSCADFSTSTSHAAATTQVHVSETQVNVMELSQTPPLREHSFNSRCQATLDSHVCLQEQPGPVRQGNPHEQSQSTTRPPVGGFSVSGK